MVYSCGRRSLGDPGVVPTLIMSLTPKRRPSSIVRSGPGTTCGLPMRVTVGSGNEGDARAVTPPSTTSSNRTWLAISATPHDPVGHGYPTNHSNGAPTRGPSGNGVNDNLAVTGVHRHDLVCRQSASQETDACNLAQASLQLVLRAVLVANATDWACDSEVQLAHLFPLGAAVDHECGLVSVGANGKPGSSTVHKYLGRRTDKIGGNDHNATYRCQPGGNSFKWIEDGTN